MKYVLFTITFLALPQVTLAAVKISEIAWMGSSVSANAEWIELHNDGGSSVDVTGWTLSDGMNLHIELTGAVGAGQFIVLERTSDDSAPGSAFLIYTGALVNTGATLTLRNSSGGIEDQVAGGENWATIGGDNVTKETAQLSSSGWITAVATPGSPNASVGTVNENETEETEEATTGTTVTTQTKTTSKSGSSGPKKIPLVLPDVTLELTLTAPPRGYVNQPLSFSLEPSRIGETLQQSLVYEWNFGDGQVGSGKNPTHAYSYPGTYVVMVKASYARQHATTRHEITILPVTFSLTINENGDVQIHNNAKYEVDLSGYKLMADESFTLPPMTILLPAATLTIPRAHLGNNRQVIALADTKDTLVATLGTRSDKASELSGAATSLVSTPTTRPAVSGVSVPLITTVAATPLIPTVLAATTTIPFATPTPATLTPATTNVPTTLNTTWPYVALGVLIVIGLVSVLVGRNKSPVGHTEQSV